MRTVREIKSDILAKLQVAKPLLRSQFSFCVGGNMLTYPVSPEEYRELAKIECVSKNGMLFGYSLVASET